MLPPLPRTHPTCVEQVAVMHMCTSTLKGKRLPHTEISQPCIMLSQPVSKAVPSYSTQRAHSPATVGIQNSRQSISCCLQHCTVHHATDSGLSPGSVSVDVCASQLSIDAVLNGLMACTRCHDLMACATLWVHAYLRGGHHQAHALLRIALFLYDRGGAIHEGINSGRGLRLRLLPTANAHHTLITCCSSKTESLKPACIAIFGSQESHGWQGCTLSMCCSEQR